MKKTQVRALTQLAKALPPSKEIQKYSILVKGEDIDFNDKLKAQIPIEDEEWYKKKEFRIVDINHVNRLKNAFARNKEQGLMDYIEWVDMNNKRLNRVFKELELQEVDAKLMNTLKGGAKNFWSNLIRFLYAFIHTFIKKEEQTV
jgi:hypothetical protein